MGNTEQASVLLEPASGEESDLRGTRGVLRVFEQVAADQPVSLGDLSSRLGVPTTTVHRALGTLNASGWIRPAAGAGKRWVVAPRIQVLVSTRLADMTELAAPVLMALREATGESVSLSVPDGDAVVVAAHLDGVRALRVADIQGARFPLHVSATGKALLALRSDEEVREYAQRGLVAQTGSSITDEDQLLADVGVARRLGYAVVRDEREVGVASVGAIGVGHDGRVVAGVGISGPTARIDSALLEFGRLAIEAAEQVAARLSSVMEGTS